MWHCKAGQLQAFRGGGGEPFTALVDGLIRSHCHVLGIPDSAIATSLRVNVADGGVDTRVDEFTPEEPTGRMLCPTAWQYKAEDARGINVGRVTAEVKKPYAAELVKRGYGFRLCVCDEFTAEKKNELEAAMNATAQSIYSGASPCLVLGSSDLAAWANRYPAFVAQKFGLPEQLARHWGAWQKSERASTPKYCLPPAWKQPRSALQAHLRFAPGARDTPLTVQGQPGVGKSRFVLEAIADVPGAGDLTVITNDEKNAVEVANLLVNDESRTAILVADECSLGYRMRLGDVIRGHGERVRVITIDNSGEPPAHGGPGIWLDTPGRESVEEVLSANFERIPAERRQAFAHLCEGYIRLAADLCANDSMVAGQSGQGVALGSVEEYYRARLKPEHRVCIEAVALLSRVGYAADVAYQLDEVATLADVDARRIREVVAELKAAPGFVAVTPRYYYVTPRIIAEVAFLRAWRRLAEPDPAEFLNRMTAKLHPFFEGRVRSLASKEIRDVVSRHYRRMVLDFKPEELTDDGKLSYLLGLVEMNPGAYLPVLGRLVREATAANLQAIHDDDREVASRRRLVSLLEDLAQFPEYFSESEATLRRLAIFETEPGIGNNATGIWRQLFRIYLSGTSKHFLERLAAYRSVVFSSDPDEQELALGGLDDFVSTRVSRLGGSALIDGRRPPPDWHPSNRTERLECLRAVLVLVEDLLAVSGAPEATAWSFLKDHLRDLLRDGMLPDLKAVIGRNPLANGLLGPWLEAIDDFLLYECESEPGEKRPPDGYCDDVRQWRTAFVPSDFAGRLRATMGLNHWHHSMRESMHQKPSEVLPLVHELIQDPALFRDSLGFLTTPDARSANTLGALLARVDPDTSRLAAIVSATRRGQSSGLLRGYVSGLLQNSSEHAGLINSLLDELEQTDPVLAAEVMASAIETSDSVKRMARLISASRLDPSYAQYLHYGGVIRTATSEDFGSVLVAVAPEGCDKRLLDIAIDLLGVRWAGGEVTPNESPETIQCAKDLLERSADLDDGADHWWHKAVVTLGKVDPEWAARVAVVAAGGEDISKRSKALDMLCDLAGRIPEIVMEEIGSALMDRGKSWRWSVYSNHEIFRALPTTTVLEWLQATGEEGARRVARHLPPPFVADDGNPKVPSVTAEVLRAFGEDSEVYRAFAAGCHGFEMHVGPTSEYYQDRARVAEAFRNHDVPAIRRWAAEEVELGDSQSAYWRAEEEDEDFVV